MGIRAGIIGCGGVARSHVNAWQDNEIRIVAVTDSNPDAACALAGDLGADICQDFRELILHDDVDAISICTPPAVHAESAAFALEQGVHVLCEKPLAGTLAGGDAIRAAARASDAVFMPAFRHRFMPAIEGIKQLLDDDAIGTPVFFNNIFCGPMFYMEDRWFTQRAVAGGGCLLDTSSHSVDLFRYLIGEISEQSATMHRHFRTTDVEDAGVLTVKDAGGTVGTLQSSFVTGIGLACIDILGQRGRICYDYTEPDRVKWRTTSNDQWQILRVEVSSGFREEIAHFLGAINGEHELRATVDDAYHCLQVIQAVYEAQPRPPRSRMHP